MKSEILVIVVTFNGMKWIDKCISSVFSSDLPADLLVIDNGKIAFDGAPKRVFSHYKELEKMGLAAPQITYIMYALKERGLDVDLRATTVEEAKRSILLALSQRASEGR